MSNHELQALPNQVLAYSDGACRGNGNEQAVGGFGAVLVLPTGEQIELCGGEQGTTNNRMELMGAIVALEHSPNHLPIQIWTDSGYVQKGITEWLKGWKAKGWKKADGKAVLNQELWQRLDQACQNRQVDWRWVKGHAGHMGNEYADTLANRGIDNLPKNFEKIIKNTTQINPQNPMENPTQNSVTPPVFDDVPDSVYEQMFDNQAVDMTTEMDDMTYERDLLLDELDNDESQTSANHEQNTEHNNEQNIEQKSTKKPKPSKIIEAKLAEHFQAFVNENKHFVAQTPELIALRPEFDGNTKTENPSFVPLLPIAKNRGVSNRQLILDTETTGLEAQNGDRIIEIGVVELVNRRFTGEKLHVYINPLREMDDEVIRVHGIHSEFLADMPTFEQVAQVVYDFLHGAEIVAHNATFDMSFLQAEFVRVGLGDFETSVSVTDSLAIAKQMYAGQRNSLDALVKRLDVGKQDRTFHGALLDSEILAEVYLAMTGGQVSLDIDEVKTGVGGFEHQRFAVEVGRFFAKQADDEAHLAWLDSLKDEYENLAKNWGIVSEEGTETTA